MRLDRKMCMLLSIAILSLKMSFRSASKEKTGRSRVTVIFMSLVRSLVPFGVFQCFLGFLTVKLDRKSFGLCKNNGIK